MKAPIHLGFRDRLLLRPVVLNLLFVSVGLVLTWQLFYLGFPVIGDNPLHLAEIFALKDIVLKEQGWWHGWFEGDYFGYPLLTYQYPLGKWIVLLLNLTLGLEIALSYKIVLIISWMLPGIALITILNRRMGFWPAVTAAALYIANFDCLYICLAGMWNQYLSAGIFLFAGDAMLELDRDPSPRSFVLTSLWVALVAVSHQFMFLLLPLAWLAVLLVLISNRRSRRRSSLTALLAVPLMAFFLTAWYFVPIILTLSWPKFTVLSMPWNDFSSVLFPLVSSDFLRTKGVPAYRHPELLNYSLGMVAAIILAVPALIRFILGARRGNSVDPILKFSFVFLIWLILFMIGTASGFFPVLRAFVITGRFALYLFLVLLLCTAHLFYHAPAQVKTPVWRIGVLSGVIVLVVLRLSLAIPQGGIERPEFRLLHEPGSAQLQSLSDLEAAWKWLRENTSVDEGRLLCQNTLYNLRESPLYWAHSLALTHHFVGSWTTGSLGEQSYFVTEPRARTQSKFIFGKQISQTSAREVSGWMKIYNCRYALVCESTLSDLLEQSDLFQKRYTKGPFSIFEAHPPFSWVEFTRGQGFVEETTIQQGHWFVRVRLDSADAAVRIKTSYHPWWRVKVNGVAVIPTAEKETGLMMVPMESPGEKELDLRFSPPKVVPVALTLVGLLACACLLRVRR
jgi:hypothetical protein